jgi:hypothetical protein
MKNRLNYKTHREARLAYAKHYIATHQEQIRKRARRESIAIKIIRQLGFVLDPQYEKPKLAIKIIQQLGLEPREL